MEKYFPVVTFDEQFYVDFDVFLIFLRKNHLPTDKKSDIKTSNITRIFKGYKGGIKVFDTKQYIPIQSILRFIFYQVEELAICNTIATTVQSKLYGVKATDRSIVELYKQVGQSDFLLPALLNVVPNNFENELNLIYSHYKQKFNDLQWQKIQIFEWHFSKHGRLNTRKQDDNESYEESVAAKWEFFEKVKNAVDIGAMIHKHSKEIIQCRSARIAVGSNVVNVLRGSQKHVAAVIDSDITCIAEDFNSIIDITCVDTEESLKSNSIHVYAELNNSNPDRDVFTRIQEKVVNILATKHDIKCSAIVYFQAGTFKKYTENGKIARYLLRDDLFKKKCVDDVLQYVQVETDDTSVLENDQQEHCEQCFGEPNITPLTISSFNPFLEWTLDVPLLLQVQLQQFICAHYLNHKDTKNKECFLKSKIERLYCAYENILNVSNKKFIGLIQEYNTRRLAIGYKSVCTVFDVTSKSGTTLSFTAAEKHLKEKAILDDSYYNCYLQEHEMTYQTDAGTITKGVRMRDCFIILLMDNLVRLKFNDDPNPGECRTKQINTLPITLQGLPKDCTEVENWHNIEICDGKQFCKCKQNVKLNPEDIPKILFQLTPAEIIAIEKFQKMTTWNHSSYWQSIQNSDLWSKIVTEIDTVRTDHDQFENTGNFTLPVNLNLENIDADDEEELYQLLQDESFLQEPLAMELDELLEEVDIKDFENVSAIPVPELELQDDFGISEIEKSLNDISLDDDVQNYNLQDPPVPLPTVFGLNKYKVPPLLTRHPAPFAGRDDDIHKLKEVLDDVLVKLGYLGESSGTSDKILFGPDHKIGNNLLKLIKTCPEKYDVFLPEFPCLHFRKSKINNIFSAYKQAGLLEILKYMKDDDSNEWAKLITADHIDVATKYIRRLSMSFHLAFIVSFISFLQPDDARDLVSDLEIKDIQTVCCKWHDKYVDFMKYGCTTNATFALHKDMMQHLDHVLALALAERLGGSDGYNLLLASTKETVTFGFLNGASSYAPYCVQLLIAHSQLGIFFQNMKSSLFSTPLKGGNSNLATDTKRELEHQDAMKGFRTGSTMPSVMRRLILIDSLTDCEKSLKLTTNKIDNLGWVTTENDMKHIIPATLLIIRQGGLSLEPNMFPVNVYLKKKSVLPQAILDEASRDVGRYLVHKYLCKDGLCDASKENIPDINSIEGPKELIRKARQSKGVTLKRLSAQNIKILQKTERQCKEDKRKKVVNTETKKIDCLSSDMNMCQALVKPDCTKPKVLKASGMTSALIDVLLDFPDKKTDINVDQLSQKGLLSTGLTTIPHAVGQSIKFATLEFAGVKFKTNAVSGSQYLKQIENGLLKSILYQIPNAERVVVCEEKYKFTPDEFKAATREQRQKKKQSIAHLKTTSEILSAEKFHKESLLTTSEGKSLISTYLARNISKINLKKNIILDIDSECITSICGCEENDGCACPIYTTPIRVYFSSKNGYEKKIDLVNIKQTKGEAEMSQFDWLFDYNISELKHNEAVASIVTSGDIDGVVVHLFGISRLWPRKEDGSFKGVVYVILQKPGRKLDVYNITAILWHLEQQYKDPNIGLKAAISLCIGGNDFIPKLYMISHVQIMKTVMKKAKFLDELFTFLPDKRIEINKDAYLNLIKYLYCSKKSDPDNLTYEDVRKTTMIKGRKSQITQQNSSKQESHNASNPQQWMPPSSAMEKIADIINLQIDYLFTAGIHDAALPNFMSKGCLKKTSTGEIEYNLGPDCSVKYPMDFIRKSSPEKYHQLKKRKALNTPQKGERRKLPLTSTPEKH